MARKRRSTRRKPKQRFIQRAVKRPGQLHRDLGVPKGKKIPASKLNAAAKRKGKVGQRARFAKSLKRMGKRRKRKGKR